MQWYNQTTGINLSLVLITNIFGLLLMIILLVSKGWTARNKYNETKIIPIVLVSIIVGCIVEPLTYIVDGVPGGFIHYIAIVLNTILFSLNIIDFYFFVLYNFAGNKILFTEVDLWKLWKFSRKSTIPGRPLLWRPMIRKLLTAWANGS